MLQPPSSGTSGNNIVFGSYGTGDKPIITSNDTITGITWAVHPYNDSIYYTVDVPFVPENIVYGSTIEIQHTLGSDMSLTLIALIYLWQG
jgi:hypothetical protein